MQESVKKLNIENGKCNISVESIKEKTGDLSNNHLTNYLFALMRDKLFDYNEFFYIDFDTLFNSVESIKNVLDVNPSINRKSILRKIKGIYALIEDLSLNNALPEDVRKRLYKFRKALEHLENYILNKESSSYAFIMEAIDKRNIDYLEEIFNRTNSLVNIKDKTGTSLFKNVCSKYIVTIECIDTLGRDLPFYRDLLNIMYGEDKFKLDYKEKRLILRKLKICIEDLEKNAKKDKNYETKLFYLNNLYEFLIGAKKEKEDTLDELSKKYSVSVKFNKDIMDSIETIKDTSGLKVIKKKIISIDQPGTKIMDDAISCEKLKDGTYLVGIYVADILASYPIDSPIIKESLRRAMPIYIDSETRFNLFPDVVLEMNSLGVNKKTPARCYFIKLTKDGEILDKKCLKANIINTYSYNFKTMDNLIKTENEPKSIRNLLELTEEKGKSKSSYIINYFSKRLNTEIGNYFYSNSLPAVYYNFDEVVNNSELSQELVKNKRAFLSDDYKVLLNMLSSCPSKKTYGIMPDDPESKNYIYAPITSPLRRIPDILNMYVMDNCYFNTSKNSDVKKLYNYIEKEIDYINNQVKNISSFERDYNNYKIKIKK